jgi:hypothetical protein
VRHEDLLAAVTWCKPRTAGGVNGDARGGAAAPAKRAGRGKPGWRGVAGARRASPAGMHIRQLLCVAGLAATACVDVPVMAVEHVEPDPHACDAVYVNLGLAARPEHASSTRACVVFGEAHLAELCVDDPEGWRTLVFACAESVAGTLAQEAATGCISQLADACSARPTEAP